MPHNIPEKRWVISSHRTEHCHTCEPQQLSQISGHSPSQHRPLKCFRWWWWGMKFSPLAFALPLSHNSFLFENDSLHRSTHPSFSRKSSKHCPTSSHVGKYFKAFNRLEKCWHVFTVIPDVWNKPLRFSFYIRGVKNKSRHDSVHLSIVSPLLSGKSKPAWEP